MMLLPRVLTALNATPVFVGIDAWTRIRGEVAITGGFAIHFFAECYRQHLLVDSLFLIEVELPAKNLQLGEIYLMLSRVTRRPSKISWRCP